MTSRQMLFASLMLCAGLAVQPAPGAAENASLPDNSFAGASTTSADGCQPASILLESQPCPGNEVGSIDTYQNTDCAGVSSAKVVNTCVILYTTVTSAHCDLDEILVGKYVGGVFQPCTGAGCIPYVCTVDGLLPQ
jgi:hypothetical protein